MQRSTVLTAFQRAAALFLAASMVPAGWAQDTHPCPARRRRRCRLNRPCRRSRSRLMCGSTRNRGGFAQSDRAYTPRHVAPPNLANTPRIDQLLHDGKLYISMNDAVALALENNLDIAIARYNLNIADTDIWRAKSGANAILALITVWCRTHPAAA